MSEAMNTANLVYEDSKVKITDWHERELKLVFNAYQMKLDGDLLAFNEAKEVFKVAQDNLEAIRAVVALDLNILDSLQKNNPVLIQTIALEGSTKDKKVKVYCHFTAFGEPHIIDWEGSLDDTFDTINTILGGKIWDLLKNKAEMQ